MKPLYNLDKIRFASDQAAFEKAVGLYESGKIENFREDGSGFSATVEGGHAYQVSVSARHFDQGNCTCYLGQNDYLCKHMIAVALWAVLGGEKIKEEDKRPAREVKCSGRLGELNKEELARVKEEISGAMKYIKAYNGPSRTWFAYQSSLSEGCARLSEIVSELPVGKQTTDLLIKLLLRLDKKLCTGGVDDSDGTVGSFVQEVVAVLEAYAKLDSNCIGAFRQLVDRETGFGWEDPLLKLMNK